MTNFNAIHDICWPDAELESITIDYDTVSLVIRESTQSMKQLKCHGYIGYKAFGFWDEVIIEKAEVFDDHKVLSHCKNVLLDRFRGPLRESGNVDRNQQQWFLVTITFIDGHELHIIAARLESNALT